MALGILKLLLHMYGTHVDVIEGILPMVYCDTKGGSMRPW